MLIVTLSANSKSDQHDVRYSLNSAMPWYHYHWLDTARISSWYYVLQRFAKNCSIYGFHWLLKIIKLRFWISLLHIAGKPSLQDRTLPVKGQFRPSSYFGSEVCPLRSSFAMWLRCRNAFCCSKHTCARAQKVANTILNKRGLPTKYALSQIASWRCRYADTSFSNPLWPSSPP